MQQTSRMWGGRRRMIQVGLAAGVLVASGFGANAIITTLGLVGTLHTPRAEHVDQTELLNLVRNNQVEQAYQEAFEHGDALFETRFNALDGGGANVGHGERFTRVPRADLTGAGEWANHIPSRATGPNAQACNACHNTPGDDGSGDAAGNVHRDPLHSGMLGKFIQRNTPHLFGAGALQRLAEEMSVRLHALRDQAIAAACTAPLGAIVTRSLDAKTVNFGSVRATRVRFGGEPCPGSSRRVSVDLSNVRGIERDLVVRPFQWKGSVAFLRDFNRGASHNEIGMQPVELVGDGVDGDFDGVVDELGIGDETALAVYVASQPRPVTKLELNSLGLVPALTPQEISAINDGAVQFHVAQCNTCHKPSMVLDDALFSEPSQNPDYRDASFPAGQDPIARGVDPAFPITFDLTLDLPNNRVVVGGHEVALGNQVSNGSGGAIINLFGDLKRHSMGTGLAEAIDEVGTGAATFLTENLWGVGTTAPYLHDGRATTLTEAILEHGGEAAGSRTAFRNLNAVAQADLIAFLDNLVLYKAEEP